MDFINHTRKLNDILTISAKLTDDYNNTTGIGDFRELSIIEILRDKLPTKYMVSKGEVMDSEGRQTKEFDIIIHLRSDTPRYFTIGERVVVPVEDVLMVGEVKSQSNQGYIDTFAENMTLLNALERFYKPTQTYRALDEIAAQSFTNRAIKPNEAHRGIGRIIGFYFSYDSPARNTFKGYFENAQNIPENFYAGFALNNCHVMRREGQWVASPENQHHDILFWLIFSIFEVLKNNERDVTLFSDTDRYFQHFITAKIAEMAAAEANE